MPTYEYRCEKCGQQFEVVQSFKDRPLRRHRVCGGSLEKVFHPRGVVFKGSGFYVTDSRPKAGSASGNGSGGEGTSNGDRKAGKPAKEKTASTSDSKSAKSGSSES